MLKKLTFAVGFGAGYVLGAKAGQERYRQIEDKFREVAGMPAVQSATENVKDTATGVAETAKQKADELSDKSKGKGKGAKDDEVVVDTGYGSAPMAGAAASPTAPDVSRP
ncbi:MAG: hypothetical protein KY440_05545 [Actinobacteria bacterium]|nr:hypothetical protein [Actinomycetota bacterium]